MLPKGWCLSTLGEVFTLQAGKNITAKDIKDAVTESHPYKCYGGNGVRGFVALYNREGDFPIIGRQGALCGNINIAKGKFYATEHAVVVESYCDVDLMWAYYILITLNLNQYATATAQPGLSVAVINDVCIPIPPRKEQERISKEIEHWFALIDQIEQGKSDLQTIIKQTKNKILDFAIHGKLVPQDPNDEPAIELLKRINPDFTPCDNGHSEKFPYEIPESWVWCSHNSILDISGGAQPSKNYFENKPKPNYIRLYQIRDYGESPVPVYIPINLASKQAKKGDILLARYGGSLGKVFHAEQGAYNVAMAKVIFKFENLIYKEFAYYYYLSDLYQGKLKEISRTAQAGFNSTDFNDMYFPLPPLAEQQRIVQKIEELFSVFNNIQKALEV
ncbi:restriction endonuclease subunit S [Bacteroides thetaiotaomicron]|uniref:Restriction endonuclease subunit S n=1 Tax=Bacteroides xylanisolvens TaxID=371601 RepID=A0AAI9S7N0_9BACE|nr:restriction endonuclease subunit S [Bacteroides thetaiotaomicron]KAA9050931.1 restriction endonuclease subunit S [Bacteroides xylanisolvens]KAB4490538.1 restriction endonuclease subunit S [Bacteroides thetaiotaomicron]KAB4496745.1 restriction endonuclease subunit S [Bacteroides thetaiotaomicron]KAB4501075.1 restriction endonuclease subunit S [Bacteroides thetaiotaomicron]KAB4507860.1 restriction endonuclease subunit S [Bacteroides thetaiotaomicron]